MIRDGDANLGKRDANTQRRSSALFSAAGFQLRCYARHCCQIYFLEGFIVGSKDRREPKSCI